MKVEKLIKLIGVSKENDEAREEFAMIRYELARLRKIEEAARFYAGKSGIGHPPSCSVWSGEPGQCNCGSDLLDRALESK